MKPAENNDLEASDNILQTGLFLGRNIRWSEDFTVWSPESRSAIFWVVITLSENLKVSAPDCRFGDKHHKTNDL